MQQVDFRGDEHNYERRPVRATNLCKQHKHSHEQAGQLNQPRHHLEGNTLILHRATDWKMQW